ncbi:hypothetical protein D9613_010727 [Agrocybe pediades]|uniref:Uncharacterized protein n=1 Tax=Agrocybe pediades TaxID=84607 RepID=A0A8H4QL83_9AGAR|nr:hypothetical protein D9613_010727 [Agrocybe pediades]
MSPPMALNNSVQAQINVNPGPADVTWSDHIFGYREQRSDFLLDNKVEGSSISSSSSYSSDTSYSSESSCTNYTFSSSPSHVHILLRPSLQQHQLSRKGSLRYNNSVASPKSKPIPIPGATARGARSVSASPKAVLPTPSRRASPPLPTLSATQKAQDRQPASTTPGSRYLVAPIDDRESDYQAQDHPQNVNKEEKTRKKRKEEEAMITKAVEAFVAAKEFVEARERQRSPPPPYTPSPDPAAPAVVVQDDKQKKAEPVNVKPTPVRAASPPPSVQPQHRVQQQQQQQQLVRPRISSSEIKLLIYLYRTVMYAVAVSISVRISFDLSYPYPCSLQWKGFARFPLVEDDSDESSNPFGSPTVLKNQRQFTLSTAKREEQRRQLDVQDALLAIRLRAFLRGQGVSEGELDVVFEGEEEEQDVNEEEEEENVSENKTSSRPMISPPPPRSPSPPNPSSSSSASASSSTAWSSSKPKSTQVLPASYMIAFLMLRNSKSRSRRSSSSGYGYEKGRGRKTAFGTGARGD